MRKNVYVAYDPLSEIATKRSTDHTYTHAVFATTNFRHSLPGETVCLGFCGSLELARKLATRETTDRRARDSRTVRWTKVYANGIIPALFENPRIVETINTTNVEVRA